MATTVPGSYTPEVMVPAETTLASLPIAVSIFDPEILKEEPTLDAVVVAASTVS